MCQAQIQRGDRNRAVWGLTIAKSRHGSRHQKAATAFPISTSFGTGAAWRSPRAGAACGRDRQSQPHRRIVHQRAMIERTRIGHPVAEARSFAVMTAGTFLQ